MAPDGVSGVPGRAEGGVGGWLERGSYSEWWMEGWMGRKRCVVGLLSGGGVTSWRCGWMDWVGVSLGGGWWAG